MHRYVLTIATGLLILVGCESPPGDGEDQVDTTAGPQQTIPDNTVTAPPGEVQRGQQGENGDMSTAEPGVSLQTILDRAYERDPQTQEVTVLDDMNEPQSVDEEPRENRHIPNQTDTLRTLHYDGLDLRVYHVSDGKEILERVTVTSDVFETDDGLAVGMARSDVEALRGGPDERQDGTYVYDLGGELPTMLHVVFSGEEVSQLEWRYPVD